MICNSDLMQGLLIFLRYDGPRGEVSAEHDQLWAGPQGGDSATITEEDIALLERYGWAFDEEIERWYLD